MLSQFLVQITATLLHFFHEHVAQLQCSKPHLWWYQYKVFHSFQTPHQEITQVLQLCIVLVAKNVTPVQQFQVTNFGPLSLLLSKNSFEKKSSSSGASNSWILLTQDWRAITYFCCVHSTEGTTQPWLQRAYCPLLFLHTVIQIQYSFRLLHSILKSTADYCCLVRSYSWSDANYSLSKPTAWSSCVEFWGRAAILAI